MAGDGDAGQGAELMARFTGCSRIDAVIKVLREAGGPMHANEISAELNRDGVMGSGNATRAAINRALDRGAINRVGDGLYTLNKEP